MHNLLLNAAREHTILTGADYACGGCLEGSALVSLVGSSGREKHFHASGLWAEAVRSVTRGQRFAAMFQFWGKGGSVASFLPPVTSRSRGLTSEEVGGENLRCTEGMTTSRVRGWKAPDGGPLSIVRHPQMNKGKESGSGSRP
ncbi:hypothetical protein NDU88_001989 [Pleurodeles waltl]|uniref:Uncharacterized protein n=1 Tax=Pleurodeles waltl TaxID=8319 RepID=A0AAV7Q8G7_PLEWA|nr:hypothetical protein NDU88_001989 [Pleurodeles waltl]